MSAPMILGRGEFIRRLVAAADATACGAPAFIVECRAVGTGAVATLIRDGEEFQTRLPLRVGSGRSVVDQAKALEIIGAGVDCLVADARARRAAGEELTERELTALHLWPATCGEVMPMAANEAARLFGDAPELEEGAEGQKRLIWSGVANASPRTADTAAAARAAQALVDIGGEDLVEQATGVLFDAFAQATETPHVRYLHHLIRVLDHGQADDAA